MSLSFIDEANDLEKPLAVGAKVWLRPFPDVTDKFVFRQKYYQLAANHSRLSLSTPHDSLAGFYLVEESEVTPVSQGAVVEWSRTYSHIPKPRIVPESFSWFRPAFGAAAVAAPQVSITGNANGAGLTTLTVASTSGWAVDDLLLVRYTVYLPTIGSVGREVLRTIRSLGAGTVTVDLITDAGQIYYQSAQKISPTRDATSVTIATELRLDYYLPGKSAGIDALSDIAVIRQWEAIASDGGFTNTLTDTTSPTVAEYLTQMGNGTTIVVEGSVIRRWKGNIFERATRYGPSV